MKALLKTQQCFYASPQKRSRLIQRFYIGNKAQISIKNPDCALTVGVFRRKISTLFLLRQSTIALYRFQAGFRRFLVKTRTCFRLCLTLFADPFKYRDCRYRRIDRIDAFTVTIPRRIFPYSVGNNYLSCTHTFFQLRGDQNIFAQQKFVVHHSITAMRISIFEISYHRLARSGATLCRLYDILRQIAVQSDRIKTNFLIFFG